MNAIRIALALALLSAGGALAQDVNCKLPGQPCISAWFRAASGDGNGIGVSVPAGGVVSINGTTGGLSARGIQWNASSARIQFLTGGSPVWFTDNNTGWSSLKVGGIDSTMTASGNDALVMSNGARINLGAGDNDYLSSDGTSVLVGGGSGQISGTIGYFASQVYSNEFRAASATLATLRGYQANGVNAVGVALDASNSLSDGSAKLVDIRNGGSSMNWADLFGVLRRHQSHQVFSKRTLRYQPDGWEAVTLGGTVGVGAIGAAAVTQTSGGGNAMDNTTETNFTHTKLRTTAVANNQALWLSPGVTKRNARPRFSARVLAYQSAAVRYWIGLTSAQIGSVDSSAATNYAAFRFSTNAGDTFWQACSGDGAAASCTASATAIDLAASHTFAVDCRIATSCDFWIDDALVVSKTTNLPTGTSNLRWQVSVETLAAAEKNVGASAVAVETN